MSSVFDFVTLSLQIIQETKAINLWRSKGHVGLLHLFLPLDSLNTYRQYTNVGMSNLGPNQAINMKEFMAYIGLEVATSLIPLNQLRQYWSTSMFSGHPDFKKVMSRNRIMSIRGRLVLKAGNQSADAQAVLLTLCYQLIHALKPFLKSPFL